MTDFSDRHTYLGASEVGQALNMSKWGTQYELWEQKTLRSPRTAHKDIFDRGHFMEDAVVDILKTRYEIAVTDREQLFVTDRPWLRSHVDGVVSGNSPHIGMGREVIQDGPGVVEFKAPGAHAVREYGMSGVPGDYMMQMQMNMYNAKCKWGIFIIMDYENWDLVPIYMEYDKALVEGCLPFLDKFWACVEQDIAPPRQEEPYRTMGPSESRGGQVKDADLLAAELYEADIMYKAAQKDLDEAKSKVKNAMVLADTNETLLRDDTGTSVKVTWRESKPSTRTDGKKAVLWAEQLVSALLTDDQATARSMADVFSKELFEKQSATSRRFTYNIKED
jgi:hypothetical protein